MADALHVLDSPVRRQIVDLLANLPAKPDGPIVMTAAEIGEVLDLHVTTARFHLDQLVAAELVDSQFLRAGVGRPRKVYRLKRSTFGANEAVDIQRQALDAVLTGAERALGGPATPEEAGRHWALSHSPRSAEATVEHAATPGAWLAKVGHAMDLLRDWGYEPELRTFEGGRTAQITLSNCPFLTSAAAGPDEVCALHRGLVLGILESVGERDVEVTVHPLVGPNRCTVDVRTRTPFSTPRAPTIPAHTAWPAATM